MATFVAAGRADQLQDGQLKLVTIANREILLARASGKYYAADGRCPHLGGRLWLGKLEGTILACPLHGSRFDLADGRVVRWTNWSGLLLGASKLVRPPRPLRTYEVKIEENTVMVAVNAA
jgi:3-phenylpropionate/trans-cinnamate dioxygenase ferredoxin subunit